MDNYTCTLFTYERVILSKSLILLLHHPLEQQISPLTCGAAEGDQCHKVSKFNFCECPIIQVRRF